MPSKAGKVGRPRRLVLDSGQCFRDATELTTKLDIESNRRIEHLPEDLQGIARGWSPLLCADGALAGGGGFFRTPLTEENCTDMARLVEKYPEYLCINFHGKTIRRTTPEVAKVDRLDRRKAIAAIDCRDVCGRPADPGDQGPWGHIKRRNLHGLGGTRGHSMQTAHSGALSIPGKAVCVWRPRAVLSTGQRERGARRAVRTALVADPEKDHTNLCTLNSFMLHSCNKHTKPSERVIPCSI